MGCERAEDIHKCDECGENSKKKKGLRDHDHTDYDSCIQTVGVSLNKNSNPNCNMRGATQNPQVMNVKNVERNSKEERFERSTC